MLVVSNKRELCRAANLVPLAEAILKAISEAASVSRIDRLQGSEIRFALPWMLFGSKELGFALNLRRTGGKCSLLSEKLRFVRNAEEVTRFLDQNSVEDLRFHLADDYPSSWSCYRLISDDSEFFFASNDSVGSVFNLDSVHQPQLDKRVRLPFHAAISWSNSVHVGATMNLSEVTARCPEQGLVTRVCFSHDGVIIMEESNQIEPKGESVLVQINLGDIELSLKELAALRSGSRIEIDTQMPIQCALRIGSTTLASGEISRIDDKVSVKIMEIF